jgi:hypothetical protein
VRPASFTGARIILVEVSLLMPSTRKMRSDFGVSQRQCWRRNVAFLTKVRPVSIIAAPSPSEHPVMRSAFRVCPRSNRNCSIFRSDERCL